MPDALPLYVQPGDDETFISLVERTAEAHGVNTRTLVNHVGALADTIRPSDQTLGVWSAALRVPSERLRLTTIEGRFGETPMLPEALNDKSYPFASARHPILFKPSNYSPVQLAVDGYWRLSWRSVWTFADPTSDTFLVALCPNCGQAAQSNTPNRVDAPVRPTSVCGNRMPGTRDTDSARGYSLCDWDLTDVEAPSLEGNRVVLDVQDRLNRIGDGSLEPPLLLGTRMENATEWMRGLRALISYAHRGIRMGNLEYLKLPDACRTAVDAAAQTMHDDPELAAGNRRGNWPPTPPALLAAITVWALHVLGQPDTLSAAALSMPVLEHAEAITSSNYARSSRGSKLVPAPVADLIQHRRELAGSHNPASLSHWATQNPSR